MQTCFQQSSVLQTFNLKPLMLIPHNSSVTSQERINFSPKSPSPTGKTCLHSIPLSFEMVQPIQRVANRCLRELLRLSVTWREYTGRQRRYGVKQLCDFLMSNQSHLCMDRISWVSHIASYVCAQNIMLVLVLMIPYLTNHQHYEEGWSISLRSARCHTWKKPPLAAKQCLETGWGHKSKQTY